MPNNNPDDPYDAIARVARGVTFMDEVEYDWWLEDKFSLNDFDISEPCNCVFGLRYGSYSDGLRENTLLISEAASMGFDSLARTPDRTSDDINAEWHALQAAWTAAVTEKRKGLHAAQP